MDEIQLTRMQRRLLTALTVLAAGIAASAAIITAEGGKLLASGKTDAGAIGVTARPAFPSNTVGRRS